MLDLLSEVKAESYINLAGGRHLYQPQRFEDRNIELHFLDSDLDFSANDREFYNSILHFIASYPPEVCRQWLQQFTLDNPPIHEAASTNAPQSRPIR